MFVFRSLPAATEAFKAYVRGESVRPSDDSTPQAQLHDSQPHGTSGALAASESTQSNAEAGQVPNPVDGDAGAATSEPQHEAPQRVHPDFAGAMPALEKQRRSPSVTGHNEAAAADPCKKLIGAVAANHAEVVRSCLVDPGVLLDATNKSTVFEQAMARITRGTQQGVALMLLAALPAPPFAFKVVNGNAELLHTLVAALRRLGPLDESRSEHREVIQTRNDIASTILGHIDKSSATTAANLAGRCAEDLLTLAVQCGKETVDKLARVSGISVSGETGHQLLTTAAQNKEWALMAKALNAGAKWRSAQEARSQIALAMKSNVSVEQNDMVSMFRALKASAQSDGLFSRFFAWLRYGSDAWINKPLSDGNTLNDLAANCPHSHAWTQALNVVDIQGGRQ